MSHKCITIEKTTNTHTHTHLNMWYIYGFNEIIEIKSILPIPGLVIANCTIDQEAVQSIQVYH